MADKWEDLWTIAVNSLLSRLRQSTFMTPVFCLSVVISHGEKGLFSGKLLGDRVEEVVVEVLREGSSDSFGFELDSSDFVACVALNGWPFTRVGVGPVYVFSEV